jgi:hypothetical protein
MIYTPVAHYYCLFRGERKSLNILLHSHCWHEFVPLHFCPEPPCRHRHIPLQPQSVLLLWLTYTRDSQLHPLLRCDGQMGGTCRLNDTNIDQSLHDGLKNESLYRPVACS